MIVRKTINYNNINRNVPVFIAMIFLAALCICGCSFRQPLEGNSTVGEHNEQELSEEKTSSTIKRTGSMELEYAQQFSIDYYEHGYGLITMLDGEEYVVVPEGMEDNNLGRANAKLIHKPCSSTYLGGSACIDFYDALGILGNVSAASIKADNCANMNAKERISADDICYVGKYSAPDYEKLLSLNIKLVVENTMIYHAPKVRETLEDYDYPVIVDRSSYETEPMGRLEWIKLFGYLYDEDEKAETFFDEQKSIVNEITNSVSAEKTSVDKPSVVFFFVSSNGYVNVRKPGDYVSKMIEMAGGKYALYSLAVTDDNALSTVNVSWEDFYVYAVDADILIYNGTIDGGIGTVEDLLKKNELFSEFSAVKNNRVYCSNNNMYQEISKTGDIIRDIHSVINNDDTNLCFLHKVN